MLRTVNRSMNDTSTPRVKLASTLVRAWLEVVVPQDVSGAHFFLLALRRFLFNFPPFSRGLGSRELLLSNIEGCPLTARVLVLAVGTQPPVLDGVELMSAVDAFHDVLHYATQLNTSSGSSSRASPQCWPTLRSATIGTSTWMPNFFCIGRTSSIVVLMIGSASAR